LKKISLFLKAKVNLLALLFCGLSSGFWMLALAKSYYYSTKGLLWDQAVHDQTLWSIAHGSFSISILNANLFIDHCFFLSFMVAPFYWIWPDPMLLQYLKIGGFFAGAYVFFLILKKYLHPLIALGAMIAFTLAPANISMLCCTFNYEPMAIPLIFLIFKALDDNNFKIYIICCVLLVLLKEQMPLVVTMFGVLALLFKKEEKIKWAIVPILMGLTIFIFEIFILIPYFRKDLPISADYYWTRYLQFGKTPEQIFIFLLNHPLYLLKQLVRPDNIKWYNDLFGVWGGLAFLSPHILLPALLLFPKTILSSSRMEHAPASMSWYAATYTPFVFLAAWNTLNHIQNKWRLPIHIIALTIMLINAFIFIPPKLWFFHPSITNNDLARQRFVDKIPPDASVLSAYTTLIPLANRKNLYLTRTYLQGSFYLSGKKFTLPDNIDYLLLDFADDIYINKRNIPKIAALNFDNHWRLKESIEDITLYVKNPSGQKADRLIERSFQPFPIKNITPQTFDNTIRLEAIEFSKVLPQKYRVFPVRMYWKCLNETTARFDILINITDSNGKPYYIKRRPIGSTIYPTYFWKKEEHIKESYFYLLPPMPQGNFVIKISIYNTRAKQDVIPAKAGIQFRINFVSGFPLSRE